MSAFDVTTDLVQLLYGDCLERMKEIPSGSVDMVLADPPYGTTRNKRDSVIPLEPMWEQLKRVTKRDGAMITTSSQPFTCALGASNLKELRYSWVWQKSAATGHLNAKRMPMKNHEEILVFYREPPTYNPAGLQPFGKTVRRGGNGSNFGESGTVNYQAHTGYPRSVLQIKSEGAGVHPTQKPVALMEYMIRTYTHEGETVLDFAMGSGTAGVACVQTCRKFIGIELDLHYYAGACSRILELP